MKITTIAVNMGVTVQPVAFESIRADVKLEAVIDPGEDHSAVALQLRETVSAQLEEAVDEAAKAYRKINSDGSKESGDEDDDWMS